MRFQLLYPEWKEKAVTFSYDDGQVFDRELVGIFNEYGMKATFHLNSGTLGNGGFVTKEECRELYQGHEIACHGVHHEYPTHLSQAGLMQEFYEDRKNLEAYTGQIVRGCSYAFGEYNEQVVNILKQIGIAYCRTVESTHSFRMPADFMRWTPSCHHSNALGLCDSFLNTPEYVRLPLFYIWGHSFEYGHGQNWNEMEQICQKIGRKENVWYTTNIDFVNYMNAAKSLVVSVDGSQIENLSKIKVYGLLDGTPVVF